MPPRGHPPNFLFRSTRKFPRPRDALFHRHALVWASRGLDSQRRCSLRLSSRVDVVPRLEDAQWFVRNSATSGEVDEIADARVRPHAREPHQSGAISFGWPGPLGRRVRALARRQNPPAVNGMNATRRSAKGSPADGIRVDSLSIPRSCSPKNDPNHMACLRMVASLCLREKRSTPTAPVALAMKGGSQKTACWATWRVAPETVTEYVDGLNKYPQAMKTETPKVVQRAARDIVARLARRDLKPVSAIGITVLSTP